MNKSILFLVAFVLTLGACDQTASLNEPLVIATDTDNFWKAYDKIKQEPDSSKQLKILKELFIDKASVGQKRLFEVRNYTPEEYIESINSYPKFYTSLRANFSRKNEIFDAAEKSLDRFKTIYPAMRPAKVYLGMGNFRTPGTTVDTLVLLGAELALGNTDLVTSELPDNLQYVKNYFKEQPIDNVGFLSVHEFVHTQQKEAMGTNLLSVALREGSAEFIAEQATNEASTLPALAYGNQNTAAIFEQFKKEMFNQTTGYWVWNNLENKFGNRDLGYYIGYALSKHHYDNTENKPQAIADLIELDYSNVKTVMAFVDKMQYFKTPIAQLEQAYKESQPTVKQVKQNGGLFTVMFSEPMDTRFRGFEYGPLGEQHVLRIYEFIGFGEDGLSVSFKAKIEQDKTQQMMISNRFMNMDGIELLPYLIELKN